MNIRKKYRKWMIPSGDTKTTDEIKRTLKNAAIASYVVGVITGTIYSFSNLPSGSGQDGLICILPFVLPLGNGFFCLITCVPIGCLVGYVVHETVNHHGLRETLSILLGIGVGIIGGIVSGILTS